jgi:cytosine/adenosine deaminase-related metal-dependent hydrolase
MHVAIEELQRCGTAAVGDVSNTLAASEPLARSGLAAVIFHELIGFRSDRAAALMKEAVDLSCGIPRRALLEYALAPHAPYSVSPRLFQAIHAAMPDRPSARSTVHLGESAEEIEFLKTGTGPWRALLEELGTWDSSWLPPGCDPVEYVERLGILSRRLIVVHGVHLKAGALQRLVRHAATLVTCPRGNRLTAAGIPPVAAFYASGLRVAIGTDSLASVPDLNLFSELAELRRLVPDVPASALLDSATRAGAAALGFETELGTIEPGRRGALIAVSLATGDGDVEEALVSGIGPDRIRWLDPA